ncbi:MAG: hypothetical protein SPL71_02990 [Oribacterium sp.]|nr:hypothetical protein [Oribacterium sp.]
MIFSLGNYVFGSYTRHTCLIRATFQPSTKQMVKLEYLPYRCRSNCTVYTSNDAERAQDLAAEQALSPGIVLMPDGSLVPRTN